MKQYEIKYGFVNCAKEAWTPSPHHRLHKSDKQRNVIWPILNVLDRLEPSRNISLNFLVMEYQECCDYTLRSKFAGARNDTKTFVNSSSTPQSNIRQQYM